MLGCSTVCPNCKHQFSCCSQPPTTNSLQCCTTRRTIQFLSGGGLIETTSSTNPTVVTTTTTMNPIPSNSTCQSPEISPSVPLTFVIPPQFTLSIPSGTITTLTLTTPQPPPIIPTTQTYPAPERELEKLTATVQALRRSGWYYEGLTFNKSDEMLKDTKIGTFLIRNSSDPRYLFSLSMQTAHGPKSVRLCYLNGYFRFDAQTKFEDIMPLFPGVIELVQYYRKNKHRNINGAGNNINNHNNINELEQGWVDPQGKWLSTIYLDQPLRKDRKPPTLKHLARMAINSAVVDKKRLAFLNLPPSLTSYMEEYPYSV